MLGDKKEQMKQHYEAKGDECLVGSWAEGWELKL